MSERTTPAPDAPGVARRTVVVGGALAAVGVLAACSSSSTSQESAPSTPAAGAGSAAAGVLGPVSQVPVGGGAVFVSGDTAVVVTQPTAGSFVGFSAVCPHQGCTCNQVADGTIDCPCHGSQFAIATGAVVTGPATTGLTPVPVKVSGSDIVMA